MFYFTWVYKNFIVLLVPKSHVWLWSWQSLSFNYYFCLPMLELCALKNNTVHFYLIIKFYFHIHNFYMYISLFKCGMWCHLCRKNHVSGKVHFYLLRAVNHLSLLFSKCLVQPMVPYYILAILHPFIRLVWFFPYKSGISWY